MSAWRPLINGVCYLREFKTTLENQIVLKKKLLHIKQEPPPTRLWAYAVTLLFLYSSSFITKAIAQLPVHVHYSIRDGLPSNKIYTIRQAPDGYIWIATNKGIARFDGNRFRNFSVSDGLPTNEVFDTYTDSTGRTWLMDFKNGIHYLKNDSLHTIYRQGQATQAERVSSSSYDRGRICVSGAEDKKFGWYWYIDRDTLRRNTFYESQSRKYRKEDFIYCDFRRAVILAPDSIFIVQSNHTRGIKISKETSISLSNYQSTRANAQLHYNKLICRASAKKLLVVDLERFHVKEMTIDALDASRIIAINRNNALLEVSTNNGLIILDSTLHIIDTVNLIAFAAIEDICSATKDRSGNIWISTRNNGIYLVPFLYRNVQKLQQPVIPGTIIKSVHIGKRTYLLNSKNDLLLYNNGQHQRTIFLPDKINPGRMPENNSLLPDKHGGVYISSTKGFWYLDRKDKLMDIEPLFNTTHGYPWAVGTKTAFYDVPDDRCYISNHSKVLSYSQRYGADTGLVEGRYNHIAVAGRNRVWLANDNGITEWEKTVVDGKVKLIPTGIAKEMQIENMIPDEEGNMITQIGGKGLMIYGMTEAPYLIAEPTIQLIKLTRHGLWMVSDNGIRFLIRDAGKYRVKNYYPNIKGLLYDEVFDLYEDNQAIVAMTTSGMLKIPIAPIHYEDALFGRKPEVFIKYADQQSQLVQCHFKQDWQNSNISFSIHSFSASYLGAVRLEYFMEGLDQSRQYTSEPLITYPVLPPGTYRFHIRAKVNDLAITSEEVVLTLTIRPRWWQSLWFKAGIFLLALTTVIFIVTWRIRRTRIRIHYQSALERKAAQMELMALQSQMNPHFIFNALGAVKSYFKLNRVFEAEKMLEDFAQLIRLYLEFSKNQLIPLQQEILALKIYTAIEQRRFEHKFSVQFFNRMNAEQEGSWQLPPMILQPFVENAINHGLFRRQQKGGRLKLFFLGNEKMLTVVIDDNGVGRKLATEIGSRLHKLYPSRGNNLVADRIQVLNGLGIAKIKYEIIDKYSGQSDPAGTRVIIHFLKS